MQGSSWRPKLPVYRCRWSGTRRIRTADLLSAIQGPRLSLSARIPHEQRGCAARNSPPPEPICVDRWRFGMFWQKRGFLPDRPPLGSTRWAGDKTTRHSTLWRGRDLLLRLSGLRPNLDRLRDCLRLPVGRDTLTDSSPDGDWSAQSPQFGRHWRERPSPRIPTGDSVGCRDSLPSNFPDQETMARGREQDA